MLPSLECSNQTRDLYNLVGFSDRCTCILIFIMLMVFRIRLGRVAALADGPFPTRCCHDYLCSTFVILLWLSPFTSLSWDSLGNWRADSIYCRKIVRPNFSAASVCTCTGWPLTGNSSQQQARTGQWIDGMLEKLPKTDGKVVYASGKECILRSPWLLFY